MALYGLRALLLAAAVLGLLLVTRRTTRLDPAFVPFVTLSGLGLGVFVAGLLGVLRPGTWLLVLVGVGALVHELVRHRATTLAALRDPVLVVLGVATAALAVYVHGVVFAHYDNFSHWALVVRLMAVHDRFPVPADQLVEFPDYPLGSASAVYAVSEVTGGHESVMMLAQGLLTFTPILGVTAFTRRRWWAGAVAVLGYVAVLATANPVATLLVDGLVGVLAAGAVLVVVRHRADLRAVLLPLAVVTAFLAVVKSSGLLFSVLVVPVLVLVLAPSPRRALGWRFVVLVVAPLLALWAWTKHVEATFPAGMESKHSLSLARLREAFDAKTPGERSQIVDAFTHEVGGLVALWVVLAVTVLALVLLHRQGRIGRRLLVVGVGTAVLVPLVFELSTLATYVSSMPTPEALRLAGFRRYAATVEVFLLVLALAALLALADRAGPLRRPALAAAVLVPVLLAWPLGGWEAVVDPRFGGEVRLAADRALADVGRVRDPVCVVSPRNDSGYRAYLLQYLLLRRVTRVVDDARSPEDVLDPCRSIVLLEPNPRVSLWLEANGHPLPHPPPAVVVLG